MPIVRRNVFWLFPLLLLSLLCGACRQTDKATTTPAATTAPTLADPGVLAPRATLTDTATTLPRLTAYRKQVQAALQQPVPILTLTDGLDANQKTAQEVAIQDPRFQENLRDSSNGAALRNEIFGVYPLRESDIVSATVACRQTQCYRVEMYNYALRLATFATIDVKNRAVIDLNSIGYVQPDIPDRLTQVALEIATNAPEVAEALGHKPTAQEAMMANTKTSLNHTRCERSEHLCVAPTFEAGERALWAIVDLTDGVLVGVRWTQVGSSTPVTEKSLQNAVIDQRYCEKNTTLTKDGWQLDYILTSSDGLRISNVKFKDRAFFDSVKLVDWHVSYSRSEGFGYSDAVGCPVFSQAAILAVEPPSVEPLQENGKTVGFALIQKFWSELWPQPCNYNYEQRYEFYTDGRFRPVVGSLGRGCGNDGMYRPVTRIALAGKLSFAVQKAGKWQTWDKENWLLDEGDVQAAVSAPPYRFTDAQGQGFYLEPGRGQFGERERGDAPYLYITKHHPDRDEGDADLSTIASCCNTDYHQGPEKFIEPTPEPLADSEVVLWYVAQMKNDDTPGQEYCWAESVLENGVYTTKVYPCFSGPLLKPFVGAK